MAEGAPLLREYGRNPIEGSNPSLSAIEHRIFFCAVGLVALPEKIDAPVAQLDRVPGYEPGGRTFESFQARHFFFYSYLYHFHYINALG